MSGQSSLPVGSVAVIDPPQRSLAQLGRWLAGALTGLLWLAVVLILWRRLAGVLVSPLPPTALVAAGASVLLIAAAARAAWAFAATADCSNAWSRSVVALPTPAVVLLGVSLSLPGTWIGGLAVFWTMLIGGEVLALRPALRRRPVGRRKRPAEPTPQPPQDVKPPPAHPVSAVEDDEVPAGEVLQQLTRRKDAAGTEQVSGWLRAPFEAGRRTASVHVAFCPPFRKTPELSVAQTGGPPTRIKTAQLLPYGVRLDLKLGATAETSVDVLLRFSARASNPQAGSPGS